MKVIDFFRAEKRKKISAQMLVLFFGFITILTFFSNTINNFTLPKVRVEKPTESQLVKEIREQGTVEARETLELYADGDITGRVEEILVQTGDKVQKDIPLVTLRKDDIKDQLEQEMVTYSKLQFVYEEAVKASMNGTSLKNLQVGIGNAGTIVESVGKEYDTMKKLYEAGVRPAYDLETLQKSLKSAQEDYKNKQEEYAIAKENEQVNIRKLEYDLALQKLKVNKLRQRMDAPNQVKSPVEGIIKDVFITTGSFVSNTTKLCMLINSEKGFELRADIGMEDAESVMVGDPVEIKLSAFGNSIVSSSVARIGDSKRSKGDKREIGIKIESKGLSGGEKGDIYIEKRTPPYPFTIPNTAVAKGMSEIQGYVWVVREKKGFLGNEFYAERVEVTILDSDHHSVAISGGITNSDKIVVKSDKPLRDGCGVRVEGQIKKMKTE